MSRRKDRLPCPICDDPVENRRSTYCSLSCQMTLKYREFIARWLQGQENGTSPHGGVSRHVRRYLVERSGNACEQCGWSRVHSVTGLVPLHINHKDGDWKRTAPDNVELLCPNCHSLTPNFGALNYGRGSGRRRGSTRLQQRAASTTGVHSPRTGGIGVRLSSGPP